MISLNNKTQYEKDYLDNLVSDCPWCHTENQEHSCTKNCYSEMDQETCWKYKGYCSEKCLLYINEELPRTRQLKKEQGIVCQCDEPLCGKCLSINCTDNNCPTHTNEAKETYRKNWEKAHGKSFPRQDA